MKLYKYILSALAVGALTVACDEDVERIPGEELVRAYTYGPQYYQDLRDYKDSDHSIAFGWVADYAKDNSMENSFLGLPDSLDICSLWGGIPTNEKVFNDMRFVQKTKGTKMFVVAITRINAETQEKYHKQVYDSARAAGDREMVDSAMRLYAEYFVDQVFLNDLDGFDADNEPEGDYNAGNVFINFMKHIAKWLGPNPDITREQRYQYILDRYGKEIADRPGACDKQLAVDGGGPSELAPYCNWFFQQAYGGGTSLSGGWPAEKQVFCCNMGDNWQGDLTAMYNQASWQPASGRKGGFGAFILQRNYRITETNIEPYYHFRRCIQIQNPAIY